MDKKTFQANVQFLLHEAQNTLVTKNEKYANADALHNFKAGAEISGQSAAVTCWGYMTKHLTALRDMLNKEKIDEEDLLEKCQDTINYVIFLYCLLKEQNAPKDDELIAFKDLIIDRTIHKEHTEVNEND